MVSDDLGRGLKVVSVIQSYSALLAVSAMYLELICFVVSLFFFC